MPAFRFRLEDRDSKHFRAGIISSDDVDVARGTLEHREQRNVEYRLGPEELAALETADADPGITLAGVDRGKLHTHRQAKPYKLVSLEPVAGTEE